MLRVLKPVLIKSGPTKVKHQIPLMFPWTPVTDLKCSFSILLLESLLLLLITDSRTSISVTGSFLRLDATPPSTHQALASKLPGGWSQSRKDQVGFPCFYFKNCVQRNMVKCLQHLWWGWNAVLQLQSFHSREAAHGMQLPQHESPSHQSRKVSSCRIWR
jgi:hypothetical protein